MSVLSALANGLSVCAVLGLLTGRLAPHNAMGLFAVLCVLDGIADIRMGHPVYASVDAAISVIFALIWWFGDGGGGTRRRLRRPRRRFRAVRRTAPATA
ncbi:hypothetical protein [Streptomyces murinus]